MPDIFREVKQTASSIRGVSALSRGSLVLVKIPDTTIPEEGESISPEKWIFGRVAAKSKSSLILLYLDPEENVIQSFSNECVVPLAPEMIEKYFLANDIFEVFFNNFYHINNH